MTISSTATRKAGPYAGNGSTVAFAFTFKVFADSDLVVTHTDDNGVETVKTLTTHYTATLNANQNSNPGGTVTMLTAPATGEKVTITSAVPKTQAVNLSDGGGFFASVVNNALDRLTIFSQELAEQVSRVMKLPVSAEDGTDPNLPTPEAGTVLGWNAGGDALVNYLPTDGGMPDPGSITATYLANDAVEEEAILDGAVTTDKLGALAVTAAKLAADAVETAKIKDANVTAAKLAADAVTTDKILDGAVTGGKLSGNSVTLSKVDGSGLFPTVVLQDQKATGTVGGAASIGTQVRTLNTKVVDSHAICTLAGNRFTLPAGTYDIEATAPALHTGYSRLSVYNYSDSSVALLGASSWGTGGTTMTLVAIGRVTIATSKQFELRQYASATTNTEDLGPAVNDGNTEVYSSVLVRKVA